MKSLSAGEFQENITQVISEVNASHKPVAILNPQGENVVVISEDDYQGIIATLDLMAIPGMAASIIEGGKTSVADCIPESAIKW